MAEYASTSWNYSQVSWGKDVWEPKRTSPECNRRKFKLFLVCEINDTWYNVSIAALN